MTDIEPRGMNIEKLGFKPVGVSDFYSQGKFVVEVAPSKPTSVFVNYDKSTDWPNVMGIKLGKGFNGFSLVALMRNGEAIERTINGSGGGIWNDEIPTETEFKDIPIEEQLINAGFKQDQKDKNFYRKHIKEEGEYEETIVARVQDGRLLEVLKPLDNRVKETVGGDFEIIDYKDSIGFLGKPESVITIRSGLMQVDVISGGFRGRIVNGSQKLLRDITESELGVEKFEVIVEKSGFKVGGDNSTDLVRNLQLLAGQRIGDLQERLQPDHDSMAGFLGYNESLLEVLTMDNDFVHSKGLTHQDLAAPIMYAREIYQQGKGREFNYKGNKYTIDANAYRGMQFSPFEDGTATNIDMTITNEKTGNSLTCSGLLPDLIMRYGFYEGKGTSYRLNPQQIIEVFDFLKK